MHGFIPYPNRVNSINIKFMEHKKKELQQQIEKINEVLQTLEANFDTVNEIADEYSFLSIAKQQLEAFAES